MAVRPTIILKNGFLCIQVRLSEYHFPNGKEELLIACLQSMNEYITNDMEEIFERNSTTQEATTALFDKLISNFDTEVTIPGYTFSSIVSEMASLSDPVRNECALLYQRMQDIYSNKLIADGYARDKAHSISLMMTASIEGGMLLCLTQKSSEPQRMISKVLPSMLKEF